MYAVGVVVFLFFSAIYYWGILLGYTPYSEELCAIVDTWEGRPIDWGNPLRAMCILTFNWRGLSYDSFRLACVLVYSIINFFAFDMAVRNNEKKINIIAIPFYALFMGMMHNGRTEAFGQLINLEKEKARRNESKHKTTRNDYGNALLPDNSLFIDSCR